MVKIAVILASYNGKQHIEEQINSLLSQENVHVDVFLSDDCSNDGTVALVSSKFPEVKITVNKVGSGSAANNFLGFVKAFKDTSSYDYFAFCDQDDIWLNDKLAHAVNHLEGENAQLYLSNLTRWDMKTDRQSIIKKDYPQKRFDYLFEGGSAGCTYVFTAAFCQHIQKELTKVPGSYAEFWGFSHDWLVYFIARNSGLKVYIDGEAKIIYRIHCCNVHGQLNENTLEAFQKRIHLIKKGWYIYHLSGLSSLVVDQEAAEICRLYNKNIVSRIYVLARYNFQLIRSPAKFCQFALLSIFFTPFFPYQKYKKYFEEPSNFAI